MGGDAGAGADKGPGSAADATERGQRTQLLEFIESALGSMLQRLVVQTAGIIIREGEHGDVMFVIRAGMVELTMGEQLVDVLQPGDIFGELALLDGEPRTATATALSECVLLPIDRKTFTVLTRRDPGFALHVMSIMARRLRRMGRAAKT